MKVGLGLRHGNQIMITQRYFERDGGRVLFRIAVSETAVFDVLSTDGEMERCRSFLRGELGEDVTDVRMGDFGPFAVMLNRNLDGTSVQIFICNSGLSIGFHGEQCVGAYLEREDLLAALDESKPFACRCAQEEEIG
ncbi:MAG TPA: hypothetical protein VGR92_13475 [Steroidobacteraceae bacterium]|nr:hypothetical protein [Steroidobacteraceae bacterium]